MRTRKTAGDLLKRCSTRAATQIQNGSACANLNSAPLPKICTQRPQSPAFLN